MRNDIYRTKQAGINLNFAFQYQSHETMKNTLHTILSFGIITVLCFTGCKEEIPEPTCVATGAGTVTDIDGNVYETLIIGEQEWMVENLRTGSYSNGDAIPNVTGDAEWEGLSTGAFCWFDNNDQNEIPYGKLYNWHAVSDTRNICPVGWHIPTDEDWKTLERHLGMDSVDVDSLGFLFRGIAQNIGGKMRATGTDHWIAPNDSATNESCFSGLPAGGRHFNGTFSNLGYYTGWWSGTERPASAGGAWYRSLSSDNGSFSRSSFKLEHGVSIRCVKDQ